ncbi:MAG: hypothetical protein INR71_02155 [Terriglobus roseus]|nr:hypothetical protein [Terriglobus roseus]
MFGITGPLAEEPASFDFCTKIQWLNSPTDSRFLLREPRTLNENANAM